MVGPRQSEKTTLARHSASGDLLRQTSESLAGRMEMTTLGGFSMQELGADSEQDLWLRGGCAGHDGSRWRQGRGRLWLSRS